MLNEYFILLFIILLPHVLCERADGVV